MMIILGFVLAFAIGAVCAVTAFTIKSSYPSLSPAYDLTCVENCRQAYI